MKNGPTQPQNQNMQVSSNTGQHQGMNQQMVSGGGGHQQHHHQSMGNPPTTQTVVRSKDQLMYLAQILGLQVKKNNTFTFL